MLVSVAATAALLFGTPGANEADAASPYYQVEKKVYVYQTGTYDFNQVNSYLQKYLKDYQLNWNRYIAKQPTIQEPKQPTEEVIQEQQPVQTPQQSAPPVEEPTAEQPATPVQEQPVQQPTAPVQEQPAQQTETAPKASQVSAYEQKVVDLTNQERAKQGLAALKLDTELSKVARTKSLDMKDSKYFSHTSPTFGSPFDMMKQFGISYRAAGENIAMGQRTPEEVVNAWMNSEGHRKNILNSSFTHIGVGHIAEGNYWTQMFIGK